VRDQSLTSRHVWGQVPGSLSYARDKSKRGSSSSIRRTTRYRSVYKLLRREERKAVTDRRKAALI